jgi:hypothetical protein
MIKNNYSYQRKKSGRYLNKKALLNILRLVLSLVITWNLYLMKSSVKLLILKINQIKEAQMEQIIRRRKRKRKMMMMKKIRSV